MKKLLFGLLTAILFMTACKKEEEDEAPLKDSLLVVQGDTLRLAHGAYNKYSYNYDGSVDERGWELELSDIDGAKTALVTSMFINIDTLIAGATYTLPDKNNPSYDKTKNFRNASLQYKGERINWVMKDSSGTWYKNPVAGKVIIKQHGPVLSIAYTIQFPTIKIKGQYYSWSLTI